MYWLKLWGVTPGCEGGGNYQIVLYTLHTSAPAPAPGDERERCCFMFGLISSVQDGQLSILQDWDTNSLDPWPMTQLWVVIWILMFVFSSVRNQLCWTEDSINPMTPPHTPPMCVWSPPAIILWIINTEKAPAAWTRPDYNHHHHTYSCSLSENILLLV